MRITSKYNRSLIALNRFGLGARPGEADRLVDPQEWLLKQINTPVPDLAEAPVPSIKIEGTLHSFLQAVQQKNESDVKEAAMAGIALMTDEVTNVLKTRIRSEAPFIERWVAFWSNHLCVSYDAKPYLAVLTGLYEREVIRPHALGKFETMLEASARHPAMLLYLDNAESMGPHSQAARFISFRGSKRAAGLNENYARELLELHTVGVSGGYSQEDVRQLAMIFTGWRVEGLRNKPKRPGGFSFDPRFHEPGSKQVLSIKYKESGIQEGKDVIRDLARMHQTAQFIARKLAVHFVADDPPESVVKSLEKTWMESDGDLQEVAKTLVLQEACWRDEIKKFRTPQDWLVAIMRGTGMEVTGKQVMYGLRLMRHALWAPASPAGYKDDLSVWADPDSLLKRAEVARTLSRFTVRKDSGLPGILTVLKSPERDPLNEILSDNLIKPADRLALTISSPAFQWR